MRKVKKLEKEVMKEVEGVLKMCPKIRLWDRLNSGKIKNAMTGSWLKLCEKGTPDFYAILQINNIGHIIFIETKGSTGRQSFEQEMFEIYLSGMRNVHYILAKSGSEVSLFLYNLIGEDLLNNT